MTSKDAIVWVTPCWADWGQDGASWTDASDPSMSGRAYEHWHLADELARSAGDGHTVRGTIVQKLWNSVDGRLRLLHETYELRSLSRALGWESDRPDTLEILTRLNLVRPLVLRSLKQIRNKVEHQDRGAPSPQECLNMVDTVWYFLRSTDIFVVRKLDSYDLTEHHSEQGHSGALRADHFVEFDFGENLWRPNLRGWLPEESVSLEGRPEALRIRLVEDIRRGTDRLYLQGTVEGDVNGLRQIVEEYFLLDMPDYQGWSRRLSSQRAV